MIYETGIFVTPDKESNENFLKKQVAEELTKKGIKIQISDITLVCIKKSIDARHGRQKFYMKFKVYAGEKPEDQLTKLPEWKKADKSKKIAIIGSGPAGLFGALKLLEKGITPVIIERGSECSQRKKDIAKISTEGKVNPNSNYCFGEGGAGTFSDGKLYTRSNKRGDISSILKIFVHFGADKNILTDAHPHIGTNKLPEIITNMKKFIVSMGGEFYPDTIMTDFLPDCRGVKTVNTITGEEKEILSESVLLATGHSATDIYKLIASHNKNTLEAKTFAVGVRIEHPREIIDRIQYHGKSENLGAAEYRLVTQCKERGVYSFCMCPGGFVVPSQTDNGQIVVNGMSSAGRNSRWSNAAIVVETRPEDIPACYREKSAKEFGTEAMAGLLWRTELEEKTWKATESQKAPAQRLKDFLSEKLSEDFPPSSYTPGLVSCRLDEILPEQISSRLKTGFTDFDKKMKGFICNDALLIATETRTSTPVRIVRDKETFEAIGIKNLFPCGEGSGYAGGIVSSAMDGEKAAEAAVIKIMKR